MDAVMDSDTTTIFAHNRVTAFIGMLLKNLPLKTEIITL